MSRLIRITVWCVVALLTTAITAALAVRIAPAPRVDFTGDPPSGVLTGFYGAERGPDGLTYAWTRPDFGLTLVGLDRTRPASVSLRYRAARPDGSTPAIAVSVDGVVVARDTLAADFVEQRFDLPARSGTTPTHVTLTITPAFVPDGDPRPLGAMVDWIELERTPAITSALTRRGWVALVPALILIVFSAALGVPTRAVAALTIGLSGAGAWIVATGFGSFVSWPVAGMAAATLGAGGLAWCVVRHLPNATLLATMTAAAVSLKLLILLHPAAPIGDAMFHAHRLQAVLAGHWYFTSITPGNYQFPYAPGLYGFASVFAGLTDTAADKVVLLRLVTTAVDGVAAAALAVWLWRWRGHAGLAAMGVAAYHLLPLSFNVLWVGNLTNLFAQGLAMLAIVLAGRGRLSVGASAGLVVLSLAAMVSHTSTFVLLTAQLAAAALWLLWRPASSAPRAGVYVLGAVVGAAVLATVAYYAHFTDVYATAWARVGDEAGRAAASAGLRTPSQRLFDVPRLLGLYYTWPGVLFAAAGIAALWKARRSSPVDAVLAATGALVLTAFLALGIVTPLDFRHYLAALPLVAIAGAAGAAHAWAIGGVARAVTAGLGVWLVVVAVMRALAILVAT